MYTNFPRIFNCYLINKLHVVLGKFDAPNTVSIICYYFVDNVSFGRISGTTARIAMKSCVLLSNQKLEITVSFTPLRIRYSNYNDHSLKIFIL